MPAPRPGPPPRATPAWPFPSKSASQYRRVDQGWDLQYGGTSSVPVLAVMPGTLQNAGPDPQGFGPGYPLLMLDQPVFGYPAVYYGHTFTDMSKVGHRVARGEAVGRTGYPHSGGNAYAFGNWLEIGFWVNGPAAGGVSGASVPGQQMKSWLLGGIVVPPLPVVPGAGPAHPPLVVVAVLAGLFVGAFVLLVAVAGGVAAGTVWAARKARGG